VALSTTPLWEILFGPGYGGYSGYRDQKAKIFSERLHSPEAKVASKLSSLKR
jgi:hypothetical protein